MHPDVEGYGVVSEGEVYHPQAFFDPNEKFKHAGNPEKQAEYQDELAEAKIVAAQERQEQVESAIKNEPAITDEQSNADPATATVKVDEPLVGEKEATVIETKKAEVHTTESSEPNLVTEGPTGTPADPGNDTSEVKFS